MLFRLIRSWVPNLGPGESSVLQIFLLSITTEVANLLIYSPCLVEVGVVEQEKRLKHVR